MKTNLVDLVYQFGCTSFDAGRLADHPDGVEKVEEARRLFEKILAELNRPKFVIPTPPRYDKLFWEATLEKA